MGRSLGGSDNFAQSPTAGGFVSDSPRYNYEGFSISQFYGFTELPKTIFLNRHFRRVASSPKRQFRASANGGRISVRFRQLQLRGISDCPILRLYGTFPKLFSESPLPTSRIFVRNDNFAQAPTAGGFLAYFSPLQLRGLLLFQFYCFTELLPKLFFLNRHFRCVTSWPKRQFFASANGGRISVRFAPASITRLFAFPILRLYGTFAKTIVRNRHCR